MGKPSVEFYRDQFEEALVKERRLRTAAADAVAARSRAEEHEAEVQRQHAEARVALREAEQALANALFAVKGGGR